MMDINFEFWLFIALTFAGVIALLDVCFFARRRNQARIEKMPIVFDYARSFFPVLLFVFSFRSFAFEPRRIPTGSLKPTLLVGDFILVNKFAYGVRLPILHYKVFDNNNPQRGDIVVFREPGSSRDLIKRVIGVPGDHLSYINKVLYVNGKETKQDFRQYEIDQNEDSPLTWQVARIVEDLNGIHHDIYQNQQQPSDDFYDVAVPKGRYFMMGDNRDNSADSRYWGFMPDKNIIGKATHVIVSFDKLSHPVRTDRIAKKII